MSTSANDNTSSLAGLWGSLTTENIEDQLRRPFHAAVGSDPNGLAPGIDVVTVDNTANWFPRDPLAEIYHFRGIGVDALDWREGINFMDTPIKGLFSETDNSDMQGTVYFVKRFNDGDIACVVRVHPSIDTYGRDVSMLGKNLPQLIDRELLPQSHDYFETSRVIVDDKRLPTRLANNEKNPDRGKAVSDCLASSIVYSQSQGIKGLFCFMPTSIWRVAYKAMGMEVTSIGPSMIIQDHKDGETGREISNKRGPYEVSAGKMDFTPQILEELTRITGFTEDMLNYGCDPEVTIESILEQGKEAERLAQGIDDADYYEHRNNLSEVNHG